MPAAIERLTLIALCAAGLASCGEQGGDQNILIATNVPADAEVETLPPDDSSGTPADQLGNDVPDRRSPEERGDGDDMVNIIDDTSSNRSGQ